jgi:hypothetical protein
MGGRGEGLVNIHDNNIYQDCIRRDRLHSVCISQLIRLYRDDPVPIYTERFEKHSMFDFLRGVGVLSETLYLHVFNPYCFRCVKKFAETRCCPACKTSDWNTVAAAGAAAATTATVADSTTSCDTSSAAVRENVGH